jgi:hypothetical protein
MEDWRLIVILPLTIGILAIIAGAFSANADHAVQFFGSFTAAIVAAGAVVGGAFYQSKLSMIREDEIRRRAHDEKALFIYSAIRSALNQFEVANSMVKAVTYSKKKENESDGDLADFTAATLRYVILPFQGMTFDQTMHAGLAYSPNLALKISKAAFEAALQYGACRLPEHADSRQPSRSDIAGLKILITRNIKDLGKLLDEMEKELIQKKILQGSAST